MSVHIWSALAGLSWETDRERDRQTGGGNEERGFSKKQKKYDKGKCINARIQTNDRNALADKLKHLLELHEKYLK